MWKKHMAWLRKNAGLLSIATIISSGIMWFVNFFDTYNAEKVASEIVTTNNKQVVNPISDKVYATSAKVFELEKQGATIDAKLDTLIDMMKKNNKR